MALLAEHQRIDSSTIQARTEEHTCSVVLKVGRKLLELLLGFAGIVDRHLAGDHIKLGLSCKGLQVRRRCRARSHHDCGILFRSLKERISHVCTDEQHRRNVLCRVLSLLLDVSHTGSLTGRDQAGVRDVQTHNPRRLGTLPLEKVTATAHCKLKQSITLLHTGSVETILDAVVESIDILENAVTGIQIVSVVEIVLKGGVGRIRHQVLDHLFRDRHVDIGPDCIGNCDIITKLRAAQNTILVRLIVAGSHDVPATNVRVVGALNDGVALYTIALGIHRYATIIQRQRDHVSVRGTRNVGLKGRGNAVSVLGLETHLIRNHGRHILTRHCLARIHDVPWCA